MGDCYRAQSLKLNFRDNSVGYDTDLVITRGMCRWGWVDEKIIKSEEVQGLRGEDIDGCLLGIANLINHILHKSIHYLTKHTKLLTTFMVLFPTKTNQSTPWVLHSNHRNILFFFFSLNTLCFSWNLGLCTCFFLFPIPETLSSPDSVCSNTFSSVNIVFVCF